MKIGFDSKGDFKNTEKWLKSIAEKRPDEALNKIGEQGVKSLSKNTPVDTGATSKGWYFDIESDKFTHEIQWKNNAHPQSNPHVNVAVLIDKGHGTRTGGYVPPKPYIEKSMDGVWKDAGDVIAEEMNK